MAKLAIIGGSGLVGGLLLDRLAASGAHAVHAILRRGVAPRAGLVQHVLPTSEWPAAIAAVGADVFISTLGTTIAQAGSQVAIVAVDKTLLLDCAAASGAPHCIAVSSVGAGGSGFYLKTKGEAEAGLVSLDFERLDILRPGLLLGDRTGPARPAERIGMALAPLTDALLHGSFRRYRSIPAAAVAKAIAALVDVGGSGLHRHDHDVIQALASRVAIAT